MTGAYTLAPRHLARGLWAHPLGVNTGSVGLTEERDLGKSSSDGRLLDGLRRAVELGANLLDTSDSYGAGRAERILERILREYRNESLIVSSKVGRIRGSAPHAYADRNIHRQFQQTRDNLYVDEVDIYTLDSWDFGPQDRYLGGAIDQVRTLQQLGDIKAIGMRGPYVHYGATPAERNACAERFLYLFRLIKPDVIWTRFNALTPVISLEGEDLFAFTARHGAGVILAAPLAHGLLTGKALPSAMPRLGPPDAAASTRALAPQALEAIAAGLDVLRDHFGDAPGVLNRLALRSCLQKADHGAAVVGFTREDQVTENFRCLGPPLTSTELALVDEVYAQIRTGIEESTERQGARRASV
ncbi:aldo/keto reductase [Streptomyces lydicus]|uniref:aldo/keto reductase n=1 Tax=Streptomyces lydicus TaxID=47763 RepID=UPI0037B4D51B